MMHYELVCMYVRTVSMHESVTEEEVRQERCWHTQPTLTPQDSSPWSVRSQLTKTGPSQSRVKLEPWVEGSRGLSGPHLHTVTNQLDWRTICSLCFSIPLSSLCNEASSHVSPDPASSFPQNRCSITLIIKTSSCSTFHNPPFSLAQGF